MSVTVGVHTHITNPVSAGYLGYLATIESWARLVDHVVVVDGGSTDESIATLRRWLDKYENVSVVHPQEAMWGAGDQWAWGQIAVNRQLGFESLQTDWAIHVDADYIAPDIQPGVLHNELQERSECVLVSMPSMDYYNGELRHGVRTRHWVLNKKRLGQEGAEIGYGIDAVTGIHLDYPVRVLERRHFKDPSTGGHKQYFVGEYFDPDSLLPYEMFRAGHFFFTTPQLLEKCMRIERAIGRWRGALPRYLSEVRHELNLHNVVGFETREDMLTRPLPASLKRVVDEYYTDEMLGGALYRQPQAVSEAVVKMRTLSLGTYRWLRRRLSLGQRGDWLEPGG